MAMAMVILASMGVANVVSIWAGEPAEQTSTKATPASTVRQRLLLE